MDGEYPAEGEYDLKDLLSENFYKTLLCTTDATETSSYNISDCDFSGDEIAAKIMELNKILNESHVLDVCQETRSHSCEQSYFHIVLLGYCFPMTLTICIFGNVLNVVTYAERSLKKSTTVKMLTVKSLMNMIFMICLVPHFFLLVFGNESRFKYLWATWPYALYVANIAGTSASWITVLSTMERYVYVAWPMQSKKWCTTKNLTRILLVVFLAAILMHLQIPLTRYVESVSCGEDKKVVHYMYVRNGTMLDWSESIYYWVNFSCALLIPSVLAVCLTIRLTKKLLISSLPNYTERKRCVTRITLATTICHLTLETPAVGVYAVAALYGPAFINENAVMCFCHVLINYANQLNASVCFFIYLLCSSKFRQLLLRRLKPLCCFRIIYVGNACSSSTIIPSSQMMPCELRRLNGEYSLVNDNDK